MHSQEMTLNTTHIHKCNKIPDINWLIQDALYRSISYDTLHNRVHDTSGHCHHEHHEVRNYLTNIIQFEIAFFNI